MGKTHARYDFETKVAAASAVVDGGMAKAEAMERFGIASLSPLKQWCRLYREGGAEALRPKPKGRPRGSGAKAAPATREQELERQVRRLEAQVAYLKKSIALKAERRSRGRDKALAVAELSGQGHDLADLLGAAGLARSTYHCALAHPKEPTGPELRARVAEIFGRLPKRRRPPAGGHGAARRGRRPHRRQDRPQDDGRDGAEVRHQEGDRLPQVPTRTRGSSARPSRTCSGATSGPTAPGRRWAPTSRSSGSPSARPTSRRSTTSAARRSSRTPYPCTRTSPSRGRCSTCSRRPCRRAPRRSCRWTWGGSTSTPRSRAGFGAWASSRACRARGTASTTARPSRSSGTFKDEFFRGRDWDDFESFKRDLEAYIDHWNRVRRQVKLKGLTPAEFREQALRKAA